MLDKLCIWNTGNDLAVDDDDDVAVFQMIDDGNERVIDGWMDATGENQMRRQIEGNGVKIVGSQNAWRAVFDIKFRDYSMMAH